MFFLTPELKPFFGGSYFPPDIRQGRPGFLAIAPANPEVWQTRRGGKSPGPPPTSMPGSPRPTLNVDAGAVLLTEAVLKSAGEYFKRMFDPRHGGFGGAPQISRSPACRRCCCAARNVSTTMKPRAWLLHTCDRMAAGGHSRPARRRLCALLGGRRMARAAFREDALRFRPTRAALLRCPSYFGGASSTSP